MSDPTTLTTDIELTPVGCEYIDVDQIRMRFTTAAGDPIVFVMKTASLVQSVNLAVGCINNFSAQVLRDLGAL